MANERGISYKFEHLRRRAEEWMRDRSNTVPEMPTDILEIIQELKIHQAELEIQNEELQRAQREITELQREYENLYEFAPCGYLTLDPRGRIARMNQAAAILLGIEKLSTADSGLSRFVDPAWTDAFANALQKAGETGKRRSLDLKLRRRPEEDRWVRAEIRADRDAEETVIRWAVVLVDITGRKRAEEALRLRKHFLTALSHAAQALLTEEGEIPFQLFIDWIGPASTADRAYVFLNHTDPNGGRRTGLKAEWCATGIGSRLDDSRLQHLSCEEWTPRVRETLAHGDFIDGLVSELPEKESEILCAQGVLAIMIFPIVVNGDFLGIIGFDNCRSTEAWDPVLQTYLRIAAGDLAQAIRRWRSERKLWESIAEKDVLLREVHHRVKNNLQVIMSLLRMHSRKTSDAHSTQIFRDCRNRVEAMSLIHETLYQSHALTRIDDFQTYFRTLCANLGRAQDAATKGIELRVDASGVSLDMDRAIAVGMIVSELVSNAFKHSFSQGKGGTQTIRMSRRRTDQIELVVENDGEPIPPDIDIRNPSSLGLRLVVAAATRQLGGSIRLERGDGARFVVRFPNKSSIDPEDSE